MPVYAVTFNHLSEARSQDPGDIYVQSALRKNVRARMIKHETPGFALEWACNFHNTYHQGSRPTFMQAILLALKLEAAWQAHADKKQIPTSGNPQYEKLYEEFVELRRKEEVKTADTRSSQLHSWKHLCNTKAFAHNLERYGIFEAFQEWTRLYVNFLDESINNFTVINIMHSWTLSVIASLGKYWPKPVVGAFILEGLKFCVPLPEKMSTKQSAGQRRIPWIFQAPSQRTGDLFKLILTPMRESVAAKKLIEKYEKQADVAASAAADAAADATATPPADPGSVLDGLGGGGAPPVGNGGFVAPPASKKRRKGKGKGKGIAPGQAAPPGTAAAVTVNAEQFVVMTHPIVASDSAMERPTTAADDLMHSVEYHCHGASDDCREKVRQTVVSLFLQFTFSKGVAMNAKLVKSHSKFRDEAVVLMKLSCPVRAAASSGGGAALSKDNLAEFAAADPERLAQELVARCSRPVEETVGGGDDGDLSLEDVKAMVTAVSADINTFVVANAHLPTTMHAQLGSLMRAAATLDSFDLAAFVSVIDQHLPFACFEAASAVSAFASKAGSLPSFVTSLFPTQTALEAFLRTRACYVAATLHSLFVMKKLPTDITPGIVQLKSAFIDDPALLSDTMWATFIGLEASTNDAVKWQAVWSTVLKCDSSTELRGAISRMKSTAISAAEQVHRASTATGEATLPPPLADATGSAVAAAPPAADAGAAAAQTEAQAIADAPGAVGAVGGCAPVVGSRADGSSSIEVPVRQLCNYFAPQLRATPRALSDSDMAKSLNIEVDGLLLKAVERSMESLLWKTFRESGCACFHGEQPISTNALSDHSGLGGFNSISLVLEEKNKTSLVWTPPVLCEGSTDAAKLCLQYVGPVSLTRKDAASFILCEVFGVPLYLNPPSAANVINGQFPELAWYIKSVAKAD
ncbi:unnamed protein product [Prorocentrum cordatum]|uniref:Uncharacterized protein n=1 Tax=Prorocentrum cordatum TaxID=2364126 RepID=A0ABN9SQ06_9DINO|nr:unnamed protein product [Polarella glacialis]